ncbi:hypothetical protein ACFZB9_06230 [Kitasatospora sp. NPDC008050]|uniref:hypothetical protein n=1 Tax=Kitasatospora sp. NPDC008050 TaxID=3364021 RepID=UPI0036E050A4
MTSATTPTGKPTEAPAETPADKPAPTGTGDLADRLRGTLPAASDLRLGTLFGWTSSSAAPTEQTSPPPAR